MILRVLLSLSILYLFNLFCLASSFHPGLLTPLTFSPRGKTGAGTVTISFWRKKPCYKKRIWELSAESTSNDKVINEFQNLLGSSLCSNKDSIKNVKEEDLNFCEFSLHWMKTKECNTDVTSDSYRPLVKSISGRLVILKKKTKCHVNAKYFGATDIAKNFDLKEVGDHLSSVLVEANESKLFISGGELITMDGTYTLRSSKNKKLNLKFVKSEEKKQGKQLLMHDRERNLALDPSSLFFQKLGISNADGKPRQGMKSKLKQCQRFCEIVGALIESSTNDHKSNNESITVVDMGCGRGYLTFSLHAYLQSKRIPTQSRGIEMRSKLVEETNGIAKELGYPFSDSLKFIQGTIENFSNDYSSKVDVLIALHACDTATDDSLWFGIRKNARVIVCAPCCHKEIRSQLNLFANKTKKNHPYHDILRHGIYRERIAETVTDSMRALLLELAHYEVQVFEVC